MTKQHSGLFAIVPASAVCDRRIGATDVRVLAAIAIHASRDGRCWPAVPTIAGLAQISARHARSCIGRLVELGHLEKEERRGQSNVYRIPRNPSSGVNHSSGVEEPTPEPQFTPPRNPSSGDPGTPVPPNNTKNNTKNTLTDDVSSAHTEFETFWQSYPSRRPHPNPKAPALAKFEAAVKKGTPPEDIIRGAQNYATYIRRERIEPKYVAQAQTWLGQERWTDYQSAMPASEAAYDSDVIH